MKDYCSAAVKRPIMVEKNHKHPFRPNNKPAISAEIKPETCTFICAQKSMWSRQTFSTHVFWQVGAFWVNIVPAEGKKRRVSESIREQRWEHRWSQSATGQGVPHRPTGLWVFHLPPSQAFTIKLTLNGIIGTTVRIQVQVRKWGDAALGSKWLITYLSTAAHVAAMEVYANVK